MDAALTEFSGKVQNYVFGNINIIAGQTEYDFPDGLDEISEFYYGTASTILGNFSFSDILLSSIQGSLLNVDFGGNIFENPSLVRVYFQKLREFADDFSTPPWSVFEGPEPRIRLGMVPDVNGVAYYQGTGPWALNTIDPENEEVFMKVVMWKVSDARAMKLAVAAEYREYGGIQLIPAFDFWNKQAEKYRTQFFTDIGFGKGTIIVG